MDFTPTNADTEDVRRPRLESRTTRWLLRARVGASRGPAAMRRAGKFTRVGAGGGSSGMLRSNS